MSTFQCSGRTLSLFLTNFGFCTFLRILIILDGMKETLICRIASAIDLQVLIKSTELSISHLIQSFFSSACYHRFITAISRFSKF